MTDDLARAPIPMRGHLLWAVIERAQRVRSGPRTMDPVRDDPPARWYQPLRDALRADSLTSDHTAVGTLDVLEPARIRRHLTSDALSTRRSPTSHSSASQSARRVE